jgi:hypothetical protein
MGALARQYLDTHSSWPHQLADTYNGARMWPGCAPLTLFGGEISRRLHTPLALPI